MPHYHEELPEDDMLYSSIEVQRMSTAELENYGDHSLADELDDDYEDDIPNVTISIVDQVPPTKPLLKRMNSAGQMELLPACDDGTASTVSSNSAASTSLFDQLAQTFMDAGCAAACAQCAQPLQSALRKPGEPKRTTANVQFSCLQITKLPMTLGDHPSAVTGPPVRLDYHANPVSRELISLDAYEQSRNGQRRHRKDLKLSYRDRRVVLERERGFSAEQVKEAWSEALKIRIQRRETLKQGALNMMWEDVAESAQRKYQRTLNVLGLS